jgi:carboxyl-terminal processing protease
MQFFRSFLITFILIVLLMVAFAGGYYYHQRWVVSNSFSLLNEAHNILSNHGLEEPPDPPVLEYGMIRGMLQAYDDPFTIFLEPAEKELQENALEGKYGGIGVQLGNDAGGYWVLFPFPESPAEKAGIQSGDRLLEVDGQSMTPQTSMEAVQAALHGPVGETVSLSLSRSPAYLPFQLKVRREEIVKPSVVWHLQPGEPRLGIIKITIVAASTPEEISKAVNGLQKLGASRFVLDLRDNPGGLLISSVEIARLFLKDGVIMEQQYRGKSVETYRVEKEGLFAGIPLVVLINHNTASAAEITAGSLKAQHRALLIGVPSYGKDSVQLIFTLDDGSSIQVTAARWWIPNLAPPLAGNGLQPDILVEDNTTSSNVDLAIQAAIVHFFGSQ